jgi:hypothetical protein
MPISTDVHMLGLDGVWRVMDVAHALRNKGKMRMRCVDCKGHIRLHDASKDGKMAAHVEHLARWDGCPRSDSYDGQGIRQHPIPVL